MAATTDTVRLAAGCCDAMGPARPAALHFGGLNGNSTCGRHRLFSPPSVHRFTPRLAPFMALCVLFAVFWGLQIARSQELFSEKARYALAVEYRRGNVERPLSLSADRQTLCFNGPIAHDLNFSPIRELKEHGLFVVRSPGGFPRPAIEISNLLDANAQLWSPTIIVYPHVPAIFLWHRAGHMCSKQLLSDSTMAAAECPISPVLDRLAITKTSD